MFKFVFFRSACTAAAIIGAGSLVSLGAGKLIRLRSRSASSRAAARAAEKCFSMSAKHRAALYAVLFPLVMRDGKMRVKIKPPPSARHVWERDNSHHTKPFSSVFSIKWEPDGIPINGIKGAIPGRVPKGAQTVSGSHVFKAATAAALSQGNGKAARAATARAAARFAIATAAAGSSNAAARAARSIQSARSRAATAAAAARFPARVATAARAARSAAA